MAVELTQKDMVDDRSMAGRIHVALGSDVLFDVERWRVEQSGDMPSQAVALAILIKCGLMTGHSMLEAEEWKPAIPFPGDIQKEYRQPIVKDAVAAAFEEWRRKQFLRIHRVPAKTEASEALIKLGLMSGKGIKEANVWEPEEE